MSSYNEHHDRLEELLSLRATMGLSHVEAAELERIMSSHPEVQMDALDLAAAALELALLAEVEPMPESVRSKVMSAADAWVASRGAGVVSSRSARAAEGFDAGPIPIGAARRRVSLFAVSGWVAAAAALVFAFVLRQPIGPGSLDAASARAALVAAADAKSAGWLSLDKSPLAAPAAHALDRGVAGDVVWSDEKNEGYMRIAGIEPNNPSEFQYQLWIFDAARGGLEQHPVDGGVFDVTSSGEVIIPIDAKIKVNKATIFAVTKEPPGGVVVSDRDIVFLAAL